MPPLYSDSLPLHFSSMQSPNSSPPQSASLEDYPRFPAPVFAAQDCHPFTDFFPIFPLPPHTNQVLPFAATF
jgi:hypothetical protein